MTREKIAIQAKPGEGKAQVGFDLEVPTWEFAERLKDF